MSNSLPYTKKPVRLSVCQCVYMSILYRQKICEDMRRIGPNILPCFWLWRAGFTRIWKYSAERGALVGVIFFCSH